MKNKKSFLEKVSSGKGFYIMAAVSFFTIIAAVVAVYYAGARLSDDINKLSKETSYSLFQTKKAETPKTDEKDPRVTEPEETVATTEKETTTEKATTNPTTNAAVTVKETTAGIINDSFQLPCSGGILKAYSQSMVYSKTMGDWRVHSGTDFIGDGETDVLSVGNGIVKKAISDANWGYILEIDYGSFIGRYCGMKQGTVAKVDCTVKKGDVIGKLDVIPCEKEDGLHLHFEAIVQGVTSDPMKFISQ